MFKLRIGFFVLQISFGIDELRAANGSLVFESVGKFNLTFERDARFRFLMRTMRQAKSTMDWIRLDGRRQYESVICLHLRQCL